MEILTLQHLEVRDVGIFGVDIELDSGHGNIEEDAVKDLADCSTVIVRWSVALKRAEVKQDPQSLGCDPNCNCVALRCVPLRGRGEFSVYLPSATLLNLGDVELEKAVEPDDELLPVSERHVSLLGSRARSTMSPAAQDVGWW